jgi:beta-N-acetylhexosaminidase
MRTSPSPSFAPSLTAPLSRDATRWIDQTLAGLTLRERVGQMVTVWALGDYTSTTDPSYVELRRWIQEDGVGGITMSLGSPIEVAAKINDFQRLAKIPLLISSDIEPGLGRLEGGIFAPNSYGGGSATILPNNMAIGATGKETFAFEAGRITGREAKAIGIHIAFAPVVDVNNNPANPVINTRSFGEDPQAVARLAAAFVRGVQGEGVAAVAKHFPGHGDTDTDSHNALPIVASDRARLNSVELVPFRSVVEGGISGVMTAHIALPAIAHDSIPATLAPSVVTGLLRDSLHFRGVTYTDALSMEGIGGGYSVERSTVLAVKAGADVLLKPTDIRRAIDAVVTAVERGEIARDRIDASVRRLLELKLRTGAIQRPIVALDSLRLIVGSAANRAMAGQIATDAVTLLRDEGSLVPVKGTGSSLVLTYASEMDIDAGRVFANTIRAGLKGTRTVRITPRFTRAQLDSLVRPGERIIIATQVRTIEGEGRFSIAKPIAQWIDSIAGTHPVIVAAHGNPYVLREFPHVSAYLAAWGRGPALEEAAARAITGRIGVTGKAPVSLPGFFARGDGLTRAAPARLSDAMADTLRRVLDRALADSAFPGAFVVVGRRSGIVEQMGVGHLDYAPSPTPDEHTLWDMASLTKVISLTSSMMQLVEQGKVELDAPVQRYLPQWTGHAKERVTVRDLLTHRSGLPAWRPVYKEATTPAEALALVLATPLDTLPRVRMVYSDLGAILMGEIVRTVSGQRIDAYTRDHVFGPIGMRETGYLPDKALLPRIAPTEVDPWRQRHLRGEVHDENAAALGGVSAHAGLFSSGADLAHLAEAYLNGGVYQGTRLFKESTIRQFTTVQDSTFSNRALGWETPTGGNSAGHLMTRPAFGHTGFTGTSFWVDPQDDLYVILLTNRVNPTRANTKISAWRQAVADAAVSITRQLAPAQP